MWSHNIFSKLVTSSSDIVGQMAYSIYKEKKLAWIERYRQSHDGKDPTNEDLNKLFYPEYEEPKTIQKLRSDAEIELNGFIQQTLLETLQNNREEILKDEILKSVKTPWLTRIGDGIVAGLLTTAFLTLLSLALWLYNQKEADTDYQGPTEQFKQQLLPSKTNPPKSE